VRVLIVLREFYCPSKPVGGAERQAIKLAEILIAKGITVTVVTGQWDWGQPRREKLNNVPVHRHFTGWEMFNVRGLRRLSLYIYLLTLSLYLIKRRSEYDLIHCHSAMFGAAVAVLTGKWLHRTTLVRAMASGAWGDVKRMHGARNMLGTRWMLSKLKNADCLVALNKEVVTELIATGVNSERIVCLPNGVETERIKSKTDYKIVGGVRVTFVGRLHPQKGVDVLLSAFKKAQENQPQLSWRLTLVGEGELCSILEALAQQLAIKQMVRFLGQVTDPFPILSQSDIFVLPSMSEGMSNALLEAMAHGLPCIATDIAGNNQVITHNENGLLVQPDDDDLAAAIVSLALSRDLRERLGRKAAQTVKKNYALDNVADQYIALYTRLLQGNADAR